MTHNPPTRQLDLDAIEARAGAATPGPWSTHENWPGRVFSDASGYGHVARCTGSRGEADAEFAAHARADVEQLVDEVRRLRTELTLAANATEYRVPLPDNGGITLLVRRQNLAHGDRWAVSTLAHGGGRAWTTEGWQDSISALSVDRLFCWPDPATAVAEARDALAAVETGA